MIGYRSTRDPTKTSVRFEEALLQGLAPDGGLYLPERIPQLSPALWRSASSLAEVGIGVLGAWLEGELSPEELEPIVREALNFPAPLVPLGEGLYVLELFHGPTLSFKDFGARTMARLMGHFLRKRGEQRIILAATSGDTGSAVADGFAGQENIQVVLLYPRGLVSEVQERQLIVQRPGVRCFAVEGTFDDCQRLVKEAFVDPRLAHLPLSSANSINIGRLLPQALYYLWAARQLGGETLNFCVPSGNLGNLTGGVLAALMGQPVRRFIAAHNANRFFPDFLAGRREAFQFHPTLATLSNAMDVGAPSNFERLYHLLDPKCLRAWVWGTAVDDGTTLARMRTTYEQHGYLACPHTAVGLEAALRYREATGDPTPIVALSTAHPSKFPDAVGRALGMEPPRHPALEALKTQPTQVEPLEPHLEALRARLLG
ncbi:MAG: threonine synthase [Meiothermus sp.]|uniref:threonine synthase n=1 Tax=Meiothermus sp. TaxID=1955249 RepID=UPI0025DAE64B|nr:threonine synthase [Meiothermus sp.]MCS7195465.1 threonine synthase [Meiothermus sp.]MDW8089795.1 threonine synthase [Meiothermus sp.]